MLSTRCGSPAWSAPEILRGEPYNEKADVYRYAHSSFIPSSLHSFLDLLLTLGHPSAIVMR